MKKLLYITGSRAEYGIMKRLLKALAEDPGIQLSIVATGMHCEDTYGLTYKQIEADGFELDKLIPIDIETENNAQILSSMAICLKEFGQYFQENDFDAVMVLGDRYEIFAATSAAAMHNIPIIHLHGGEKTLGNYDEFIRHAITKMSKLHLASTGEYRNRIIQLGEKPSSVINIGALGAENAMLLDIMTTRQLEEKFGVFKRPYFMVVFHPETITNVSVTEQMSELINALNALKDNYDFVFIGSNSDTGSDSITQLAQEFCKANSFKYMTSVKPEEYLSLIQHSCGLIGNSSSGLIEVPSLKVPTINIGDRQKGRVRGDTVIDTVCEAKSITNAVASSQRLMLENSINPYYKSKVLDAAHECIRQFLLLPDINEPKDFFDLPLKD